MFGFRIPIAPSMMPTEAQQIWLWHSLICFARISLPPNYSVIDDPDLRGLPNMPKDLVGKVREQPAHDGLEAFWASGCVQSLALVLGFGPRLRILSTWQDRWWYWASRGSCEAGYIVSHLT